MNEVYAFIAGLLENGGFVTPEALILTLDRDVAQKLTNRLGVGSIAPSARGKFSWTVQDVNQMHMILQGAQPHLGQRRQLDVQRVLAGGY